MAKLNMKNHTVIFGSGTKRALDVVSNLSADNNTSDICLVMEAPENPDQSRIENFVSGDISERDVRERCCLKSASCVIIFGDNDSETIGESIIARAETSNDCRIVLYFSSSENARRFNSSTDDRIVCVPSVDMDVLVQESIDKGASSYFSRLVDNEDDGTFMNITVPSGVEMEYSDVACNIILSGISPLGYYDSEELVVCPDPKKVIKEGDMIAVAAKSRGHANKIKWK